MLKIWLFDRSILLAGLLLLLGAGWTWFSRSTVLETTRGGVPAPQTGFMAPDFEAQDASGKSIRLSQLRGKPVLINIWASWCPPCRAEMPALQRVYQEFQGQGLVVLAVNAANQDDAAQALSFARSLNLTFPILFDQAGDVSHLYQVRALPSSFFVDTQGVIQDVVVGGPMAEVLLRIHVQELLKTK